MKSIVFLILAGAGAHGQSASTLKDAYQGIFVTGAALNPAQFEERDARANPIIAAQFNTISPENDADPKAELYYNDYSLENQAKRKRATELIWKLKAAGAPVTAIGLQGHSCMEWPTVKQKSDTIEAFAALGIGVNFSELDVDVLPATTAENTADVSATAAGTAQSNPYQAGLPHGCSKSSPSVMPSCSTCSCNIERESETQRSGA